MDVVGFLKALFSAVAGVFGHTRHRSELNNADDVRRAETGRADEKLQDKAAKAIRRKDVSEMRELLGCFFAVFLIVSGLGCGTVTPVTVVSEQASFDGNEATSGFLGFNADGSGSITPRARDRYNALLERYQDHFLLPHPKDFGVTPEGEAFRITAEGLQLFVTMNSWFKQGR